MVGLDRERRGHSDQREGVGRVRFSFWLKSKNDHRLGGREKSTRSREVDGSFIRAVIVIFAHEAGEIHDGA